MPGKRTVNISNTARLWTPPQGHETEIPQVLHTSPASCLGRRTHCLPGVFTQATSAVFYREEKEYFWRKELLIPRMPKPWVQNIPRKENSTYSKCNRMTLYHKPQLFWLLYSDDKEMCWSEATLLQGTWKTVGNSISDITVSIKPTQQGESKLHSSSRNSKWPSSSALGKVPCSQIFWPLMSLFRQVCNSQSFMLCTGATTTGKVFICGNSEGGSESSISRLLLWKVMTKLLRRGDASWNGSAQVPPTFNIHKKEADKVSRN